MIFVKKNLPFVIKVITLFAPLHVRNFRGSSRAKNEGERVGNRIRDNQLDVLRQFKEVTYAFANFVCFALRTVLEWVVSVANFPEEVDLILASKEGSPNAVDRCVAPSLSETSQCACIFITRVGQQTS